MKKLLFKILCLLLANHCSTLYAQEDEYFPGRISCNFSVSPSGAAVYEIPFELPAGTGGLQPSLSLLYNSNNGNSIAGIGWDIDGTSAIRQTSKSIFFDNEVSGLDRSGKTLSLDGQRIFPVGETKNGETMFRKEIEDFSKITRYGTPDSCYFLIRCPDGKELRYERAGDKNFLHENKNATSRSYSDWYLTEVTDRNGNQIRYNYQDWSLLNPAKQLYLSSVEYGGNKIAGTAHPLKVTFLYELRSDKYALMIDGKKAEYEHRLKAVEVRQDGELFRRYTPEYETGLRGESLMRKVHIEGQNGDKYPPTRIGWHKGTTGNWGEKATMEGLSAAEQKALNWTAADFDGDGKCDLIAHRIDGKGTDYTFYTAVYSSIREGNNIRFRKTFTSSKKVTVDLMQFYFMQAQAWVALVGEFRYGGMLAGKFSKQTGKNLFLPFSVKAINGTASFTLYDMEKNTDVCSFSLQGSSDKMPLCSFADLNADGMDDIVVVETEKVNGAYPITIIWGGEKIGEKTTRYSYALSARPEYVYLADFDGDGLTDIALVTENATDILRNRGGKVSKKGIAEVSFTHANSASMPNATCSHIRMGDFNGDGIADFIFNKKNSREWFLLIGNGMFSFRIVKQQGISALEEDFTTRNDDKDDIIVADFNADGKSDVLILEANYKKKEGKFLDPSEWGEFENSYIRWMESSGEYLQEKYAKYGLIHDDIFYRGLCLTGDFNGNGYTEVLNFGQSLFSPSGSRTNEIFLHNQMGRTYEPIFRNLVYAIIDGLDYSQSCSYERLTDNRVYTADSKPLPAGLSIVRDPLQVVRVATQTGSSIKKQTHYSYRNGIVHTQGKGWLGFEIIQTADSAANRFSSSCSRLDTEHILLLPEKEETSIGTEKLNSIQNFYSLISQDEKSLLIRQDSVIEENFLNRTTCRKSFSEYNPLGTAGYIRTLLGDGSSETLRLSFSPETEQQGNLPEAAVVTQSNGSETITRKSLFKYDERGNCTQASFDPDEPNGLLVKSTFDTFGNVVSTDSVAGEIARSYKAKFDTTGRYLLETVNPAEQKARYSWQNGNIRQIRTEAGSLLMDYDGFGRPTEISFPDGSFRRIERKRILSTVNKYFERQTASNAPEKMRIFNAFGKETMRYFYGPNGLKINKETSYYENGAIKGFTNPYSERKEIFWTKYTYDDYGRTLSVASSEKETSFSYNGRTTTEMNATDTIVSEADCRGNITERIQNGKRVELTYDAAGRLVTVAPEGGEPVYMAYDKRGNRIRITDPDGGTLLSRFDGLGNLLEAKECVHRKGDTITTTLSYDRKGFLTEEKTGSEACRYEYDEAGRLTAIENGIHRKEYTYDSFGRQTGWSEQIDGLSFSGKTEYDSTGRAFRRVSPSGYVTEGMFDQWNNLIGTRQAGGAVLWQLLEVNARMQPLKEQYGNLTRTGEYDRLGLPLSDKCEGIFDFSYLFDSRGDLLLRADNRLGQEEVYTYDGQNRLKHWRVFLKDTLQRENSVTYDDIWGNISEKSDPEYSLNYGEFGFPPHAVTSVDGPTDGMPDMARRIVYTDFKKVRSIACGKDSISIHYGADRQRRKSEFFRDRVPILSRYYGDGYVEEHFPQGGVRKIDYLSGANGLVGVHISNNGTDSLLHAFTDKYGSLFLLADTAGKVVERLAFDPWGNRRNPADWTQRDTSNHLLAQGFTMHEHLDGFGLINMNGRVYDPILSCFLSPDPFVQDPGNWLNFNRYAYCFGNPVRYADPTGEYATYSEAFLMRDQAVKAGYNPSMIYNVGDQWLFNTYEGGQTIGINSNRTQFSKNSVAVVDRSYLNNFYKSMNERNANILKSLNNSINQTMTHIQANTDAIVADAKNSVSRQSGSLNPINIAVSSFNASVSLQEGLIAATGQSISDFGKMGRLMNIGGKAMGITGTGISAYSAALSIQSGNNRGYLDVGMTIAGGVAPFLITLGVISNPIGWTIIGISTVYGISTAIYDYNTNK